MKMSLVGSLPLLPAINGMVCCPSCGQPAIVDGRFRQGTAGLTGRLRIWCTDGHGWLLLADRVRPIGRGCDRDLLPLPEASA